MSKDDRFDNPDRNDLEITNMGSQMPMKRISPEDAQLWQWYNNGKRDMWLPADSYSEQKYVRIKKFKIGKLSDEQKKNIEEGNEKQNTEYQLAMNF